MNSVFDPLHYRHLTADIRSGLGATWARDPDSFISQISAAAENANRVLLNTRDALAAEMDVDEFSDLDDDEFAVEEQKWAEKHEGRLALRREAFESLRCCMEYVPWNIVRLICRTSAIFDWSGLIDTSAEDVREFWAAVFLSNIPPPDSIELRFRSAVLFDQHVSEKMLRLREAALSERDILSAFAGVDRDYPRLGLARDVAPSFFVARIFGCAATQG